MAGLQPVGANVAVDQRIAVSLIDIVEGIFLLSIVMIIFRKILDRPQCQRRQIVGSHIVIRVRQAIDIGEMAAG